MKKDVFRAHITYETIADLFFDLADERYPSSDKMNQMVSRIVAPMTTDPLETVTLKIALLNSMRDMIKQVSPLRIYRSIQHRDDFYLAVIEALEDLEDELEELEEKALNEEETENGQ